jgi:chromosome segregation ATPase
MAKNISKKIDDIVEHPVISEKALAGVTFSSDDKQYLKREFEEMHEFLKDQNTENQRFIAEIIMGANNLLFNKLDTINESISAIRLDIGKIQDRIENIERKMENINTELNQQRRELDLNRMDIDNLKIDLAKLKAEFVCLKGKVDEIE